MKNLVFCFFEQKFKFKKNCWGVMTKTNNYLCFFFCLNKIVFIWGNFKIDKWPHVGCLVNGLGIDSWIKKTIFWFFALKTSIFWDVFIFETIFLIIYFFTAVTEDPIFTFFIAYILVNHDIDKEQFIKTDKVRDFLKNKLAHV